MCTQQDGEGASASPNSNFRNSSLVDQIFMPLTSEHLMLRQAKAISNLQELFTRLHHRELQALQNSAARSEALRTNADKLAELRKVKRGSGEHVVAS